MQNTYELVALFPTKMNDILAEKTLTDMCKTAGFKISEVDKWGIKPLVYPIKKENKAYYLRLVIAGGDAAKLSGSLKLDESMLRHLLIKTEVAVVPSKKAK